ncbi:javelin-like isoform 3-T3 [Glossina fuscipes fuscipes]
MPPSPSNVSQVDGNDLAQHGNNINFTYLANNFDGNILRNPMDCIPLAVGGGSHHPHLMASSNTVNVTVASAALAAGSGYSHHPNLNANPLHQHHHHHLLSHNTAYANSYAIHHGVGNGNHHHIHSEQTKSLQELQHEVGALLEFRDLVIETFPDLKQKMASMSSAASTTSNTGGLTNGGQSVGSVISAAGSTATLTSGGTLVSRREWEPGIRIKRKISQKETSQPAATELSSLSLTRSRSNSHSGKKEPKSSSGGGSSANGGGSGENNNGSVIQDSGFSTETSSSKEGHSASSTNGASTGAIASNRLSCPESDDELLNLLDVIHRKSNRLRDEVEHLQNYERQQLRQQSTCSSEDQLDMNEGAAGISKSSSSSANTALTPKTFREHVERLSKEDIKQLRRERDRLLDKLAEMEAETLTGRIKAAKMNDQVEELINVKKELEEQLKLAMAQKLELSSRIQQLQQQQQSKTPLRLNHQDRSSQIIGLCASANTVVSTVSTMPTQPQTDFVRARQQNTFQPLVVDNQQQQQQQQQQMLPFPSSTENSHQNLIPFHQSSDTTTKRNQQQPQQFSVDQLGRLDGIISTTGSRANKCRVTDSKRFAAILLETSVIELQRQLLTLTVQNQVLTQKLEQASKSKSHLVKRLDKTKDDVEDLRFQLEEKNIELEGTKAQLRVLESRLHSTTPNSGAGTNSYLHSHQDYETNRSSASTTLMMSRRDGSEIRSQTPLTLSCGQMPQPAATQISTPSMKAMVPLPMDELQHNSSSTESAHDHELQLDANNKSIQRDSGGSGILSISVGGISPFEKQQHQQQEQKQQHQQQITALRNQVQALKKFSGATTKPSKIPLPGSKAAAYFAGKPPTGRPSTAGRSPPSVNSSTSSNRSPLSRSTGNLLYSKSPNSLKRTDSAQSIRKDNNHNSSSLSTNTSRSSTSSSIPLATTPYGSTPKSTISYNTNNNNNNNSPSSRVLQNSPLPKPKRESLSTRVKHMDSLSRAYNHLQQNHSNNNDGNTGTTVVAISTTPSGSDKAASSCVSSTPKTKTVTSQLTSSLRKDLQLSSSSFSHGSQAFPRRATGGITFNNTNPTTTRRFSSASVVGARMAAARQAETDLQNSSNVNGSSSTNTAAGAQASSSSSGHGASGGGGNGTASDSDSGKNFSFDRNYGYLERDENPFEKSGLNKYFEKDILNLTTVENKDYQSEFKSNKITLSQYFEKELVDNSGSLNVTDERYIKKYNPDESLSLNEDIECDKGSDELDFYTSYASYMNSSDPGSDTVLVTFDYGFSDSLDDDNHIKMNCTPFRNNCSTLEKEEKSTEMIKDHRRMYRIREENFIINDEKSTYYENDLFKVNHMRYNYEEVNNSILSSLEEYNVDTSGDYGSWQQSEDDSTSNRSFYKYNYEDLIRREICEKTEDGNEHFYYNSLDYLN